MAWLSDQRLEFGVGWPGYIQAPPNLLCGHRHLTLLTYAPGLYLENAIIIRQNSQGGCED